MRCVWIWFHLFCYFGTCSENNFFSWLHESKFISLKKISSVEFGGVGVLFNLKTFEIPGDTKLASLVAQIINHLCAMWETRVQSLGQEDPLEKEIATHSSMLAWKMIQRPPLWLSCKRAHAVEMLMLRCGTGFWRGWGCVDNRWLTQESKGIKMLSLFPPDVYFKITWGQIKWSL